MKKSIYVAMTLATICTPALAAKIDIASITPAQEDSINQALHSKIKNQQTAAAVAEANETIAEFMKIESCISGYNATPLNKFAAPGKVYPAFNYIGLMPMMKFHSKSSCLTVSKIHGFEMPAKNALSFEVVFAADDSGDIAKRHYTLQKQDDGSWLFR
jgi:hypothetical protein